jgi:glycosyltransferase involved in cell wall biosynthesis
MSAPLHVVHVIDSLAPGGAETSLAAMAPSLVRRGVRLEVIALKACPGLQAELRDGGAAVTELQGGRLTSWRQLRALLQQRRPALVHTTLFEADLAGRIAARVLGIPVVSTLANDSYGTPHRAEQRARPLRLRAAHLSDAATARFAVRLHALSAHVADVMARRLRYPRSQIDVVARGRDPDALGSWTPERRARIRERLGVSPDERLMIAVARQENQKGLDVLIDAVPRVLAELPSTRVVVAGRVGNATASLRRQLGRIDGAHRVEFLGARSDVADLLCASDVFVLPSRREGFGGAILEAMALECPIIVSDLPSIREVVDDSTAVFVPPDDADALGAAVVRTLSTGDHTRQRAIAARRRFLERFTVDTIADQMLRFYCRALDSSRS